MKALARVGGLLLIFSLPGCGHLKFEDKGGLTYYEPVPYLSLTTTPDCVTTAAVIVLPGARKTLRFAWGYGTADLSASVTNGMLTAVGQKTDTKIPETIGAVASLVAPKTTVRADEKKPWPCSRPPIEFYRIDIKDGELILKNRLEIPTK